MRTKTENTSLSELALELNRSKSGLAFYVSSGMLKPTEVIGRMAIFNREKALKRIKEISDLKKAGLSNKEIAKKFEQEDAKA